MLDTGAELADSSHAATDWLRLDLQRTAGNAAVARAIEEPIRPSPTMATASESTEISSAIATARRGFRAAVAADPGAKIAKQYDAILAANPDSYRRLAGASGP